MRFRVREVCNHDGIQKLSANVQLFGVGGIRERDMMWHVLDCCRMGKRSSNNNAKDKS
jgi:hypothetical protein